MKSRWAWLAGVFPVALVVIVTLALLPDRFKPPNERAPRAGEKAPELLAIRPAQPRPWKVAFEVPNPDTAAAAYVLEDVTDGRRFAIVMECRAARDPRQETCTAEIPRELQGRRVQLVQLFQGQESWRSPERLNVPAKGPDGD